MGVNEMSGISETNNIFLPRLNRFDESARWKGAGLGDYYCSLCQHLQSGRPRVCPNCGTEMDNSEEDYCSFSEGVLYGNG